jgi:hypothetical protein
VCPQDSVLGDRVLVPQQQALICPARTLRHQTSPLVVDYREPIIADSGNKRVPVI